MTNEEIDKLEAGREMDALVAEVMGWRDCEGYWEDEKVIHTDVGGWCPSQDISAAWDVLHLGHPCGWFDSYYLMRYGNGYAIAGHSTHLIIAEAPTAPLAICRARLKAAVRD